MTDGRNCPLHFSDWTSDAPLHLSTPAVTAESILATAGRIVGGDRAEQYGDMVAAHARVGELWTAYLDKRLGITDYLTPQDVALMMVLLKVARTQGGAHSIDNYVDIAGYAGCAGEIAERTHKP